MKEFKIILVLILSFNFSYGQSFGVSDIVEIDGITYFKKTSQPLNGRFIEYYEDGKNKGKEGYYKDGYLYGVWTWYYKDGKKKRESEYLNNKKNGKTTYWFKDGKIQSECNYLNDEFDGNATWYHPNGIKKKAAVYKNGTYVGGTVWDETGQMIENNFSGE